MSAVRSWVIALLTTLAWATVAAKGAAAPPSAGEDGATLAGVVRDAETSEPLTGAVVSLTELRRAAITGADGAYSLHGVPPGPHHIAVRLIGYAPRTLHALVPAEGVLEINVAMQPRPLRIRGLGVRSPVAVRGLDPRDSTLQTGREISAAAIRNHPVLTEPDVFQALEGGELVLRPETPSGLHVRGSGTDQLAYLLDGVPVFNPYHAAGTSSAWNPDALARLEVTSAEQSVAEPHALAGSVHGATLSPGDHLRAQGSVSTSQARVTLDGPLGLAASTYLLSARAGFTGLLPRKNESSHLRGDTGDWLVKLNLPSLVPGHLSVLGYDSANEIEASATAGSEAGPGPAASHVFEWRSRSWGGDWRKEIAGATVKILGWSALGSADARWLAQDGPVHLSASRRDVGLLLGVKRRAPRATVQAGLRIERSRTSYRLLSDSSSAGDVSLGARTPAASGYAHCACRIGARTEVDLGAALAKVGDNLYPSPRAALRLDVSRRWSLSASYARSHQFAQSLRNQESVVGTVFPADLYLGFGGEGGVIPVAHRDEGIVATAFRPAAGLRITAQGYVLESSHLVLVAPRSGDPFSRGPFVIGAGDSRGVSVEVSRSAARYAILASYGYQRVRLEYGDSSFIPEHGASHSLSGGIVLFPRSTLSIRLGGKAIWGRTTTVAVGEFEWEACNLLDQGCEFGGSPHYSGEKLGGARLPAYYRLDLGVRQHWHFTAGGRDVSIAAFAAVTNLLGRANVLTFARNPSTDEITEVQMRPRAPLVVGLDWRY